MREASFVGTGFGNTARFEKQGQAASPIILIGDESGSTDNRR